ncbi:MAG: DNA primase [Alphaproteobacteria bacterium]
MSIPARFMDEIRNRLTLSEVIGKRVRLTRAGRELKGCCPFHKEKTPSFTVNDDKQFYHCFGCGAHGDVIGFVMQHDNLSFVDAVEMLAAQAGLQVPKPSPEETRRADTARDLYKLVDVAARWFQEQLHNGSNRDVLSYLKDRGLSRETLEAARVGFAPADRQALRTYLKAEGFSDDDMIKAGLVRTSEKSSEPYVFFRERVIFPVADRRGRVVAFGGRTLPEHMMAPNQGDYKPAKYINSPDTPLFDKGRMVYGEAPARLAARDGLPVIVTEGYMDVIACQQAGFKGAIAPMGTALTDEQILTLWKMIVTDEKMPILCFDGDNAGRQAAARASARVLPLLGPGRSVKFAFMPQGEDPDSLLRSGKREAFQGVLDSALSLFDYIWMSAIAGRDLKVPEIRAQVSDTLQTQIKTIADREVQRHYQALVRARISENFFAPKWQGGVRSSKKPGGPSAIKPRAPGFRDINARIFMATITNYPGLFDAFEEELGCFPIEDGALGRLRQGIISVLSGGETLEAQPLYNYLIGQGFQKEMNDISGETVYIHAAFSRPGRDSVFAGESLRHWLAELQDRNWAEINQGWKKAFQDLNENDEKILSTQVAAKIQGHQ